MRKVDMIKRRGPVSMLSLIMSYKRTYVGHLHRFFYRSMVQKCLVQGHELRKLSLLKIMEVSQSLSLQNHRSDIHYSPNSNRSKLKLCSICRNQEKVYITNVTKHFYINFMLPFLTLEINLTV